tara:strand:+ start:3441 stop:3677 length:237 start_codon:yes stop_codon:yes gene_type:complete
MANIIRKIVVGPNPKDAMAYYVGMRAGQGNVSAIMEDDRSLYKYNVRRYEIYIEDDDSSVLWKTIENQPVLIEYDCNF